MLAERLGVWSFIGRTLGSTLSLILVLAACGGGDEVASVDGTPITAEELSVLHPATAELDPDDTAASVFLLVLRQILVVNAEKDFSVTLTPDQIETAFVDRVGGPAPEVEELLANRGVTPDRVRIEAELDVLRRLVEDEFVAEGGPGIDLDAAYRSFLSSNSVSCVLMLAPTSSEVEPEIKAAIDAGATLDQLQTDLPDAVEEVDLGCLSPVQHTQPVQSVAADGEVGKAYAQEFSDGTFFVAGVTERDAPAMADVMDEVIELAARSQGRVLFDEWAFELLRNADVEVSGSIGTWESTADTGGVPTVVPPAQ